MQTRSRLRAMFVLVVVSAFIFLVRAPTTKSQNKPDLSGTWLLNVKKSEGSGLTSRPDVPIRISHHDPEFRLTLTTESSGKTVTRDLVYHTDGRGEINPATSFLTTNPQAVKTADVAKQMTTSTTRWNGNKIVTRARLRLAVAARMIEYELIDEWKLSADGKVLIQTSRIVFQQSDATFIPAIVPDKKRVYNRI